MFEVIICIVIFIFMFLCFKIFTSNEHTTVQDFYTNTLQTIPVKSSFSHFYVPKETQYIDAIYCVVLPERKQYIKKILKKNKIPNVIFVEAITENDLSEKHYKMLSTTFSIFSPIYAKMTKLPVHLSYLYCMKHAINYNYDTILILEDDIFFQKSFLKINQYVKEFLMHENFDVLYLGYCFLNCKTKVTELSENILSVPEGTSFFCKHAMVHRTHYFYNFLKDHKVLNCNSDVYFLNYYKKNNIQRAILKEPVIFQNREKIPSRNENHSKYLKVCKF